MLFRSSHPSAFLPFTSFNFASDGADNSGGGVGSGESSTASADGDGNPSAVVKDDKAEEKKSFTQKELDFLFADRSNRARNEATTEILKVLGVENIDMAKTLIQKQMQVDEANKTELQKAQEEAAQNKQMAEQAVAEAEAIKAAAREQLVKAEVIRQVTAYNVNNMTFRSEAVDDVWMLIDKAVVKDDDKGGFTGIKEAVEKVAKDRPHWLFNPRNSTASHGTPNSSSKQAQGKQDNNNQPGKKLVTL